jgi:hypothetical protein
MLVKLWCELHPKTPMQLQLTFRNTEIKHNSKGVVEDAEPFHFAKFSRPKPDWYFRRLYRSRVKKRRRRGGMEPFAKALEVIAEVMREGAATHPDNDWVGRGPEYHLGRAEEHLRLWHDGDSLRTMCYFIPATLRAPAISHLWGLGEGADGSVRAP